MRKRYLQSMKGVSYLLDEGRHRKIKEDEDKIPEQLAKVLKKTGLLRLATHHYLDKEGAHKIFLKKGTEIISDQIKFLLKKGLDRIVTKDLMLVLVFKDEE